MSKLKTRAGWGRRGCTEGREKRRRKSVKYGSWCSPRGHCHLSRALTATNDVWFCGVCEWGWGTMGWGMWRIQSRNWWVWARKRNWKIVSIPIESVCNLWIPICLHNVYQTWTERKLLGLSSVSTHGATDPERFLPLFTCDFHYDMGISTKCSAEQSEKVSYQGGRRYVRENEI